MIFGNSLVFKQNPDEIRKTAKCKTNQLMDCFIITLVYFYSTVKWYLDVSVYPIYLEFDCNDFAPMHYPQTKKYVDASSSQNFTMPWVPGGYWKTSTSHLLFDYSSAKEIYTIIYTVLTMLCNMFRRTCAVWSEPSSQFKKRQTPQIKGRRCLRHALWSDPDRKTVERSERSHILQLPQ